MIRFLQTPSKTKKYVLGGLLLVICAAMVITLIPGGFLGSSLGFGGPGQGVVASVAGQDVTTVEVERTANRMARQQKLPNSLMPYVMQQTVQQLITEKALLAEAERLGIRISDREMLEDLQQSPLGAMLFHNGSLLPAVEYQNVVENNFSLTVPEFERLFREELILHKLESAVASSVVVTDDELRQEFLHRNAKVKFEYAMIDRAALLASLHPADSELQSYYQAHKDSYNNSLPEKRKTQFVVVDTDKLKAQVQVTPDDLKRYYDAHIDQFKVPDEVEVRHILIKTPEAAPGSQVDQKAFDAARTKAQDVLKQLKAGGDFAALAKKDSDDPGSARNGGNLGWIQRGRTVPEFERAAFSLNKSETSGLVQSTFGFHIIQVLDKHTAHVKTLDEVKAEITPMIATTKAAPLAEQLANTIKAEARTSSLASAAAKHNLTVQTQSLTRGEPVSDLGNAPEFTNAVFVVPHVNDPADAARVPQGYAVFQVTEITPPATPTFEQVKGRVENDLKNGKVQELVQQKTRELADRAHAENDLAKAAKEVGATLKTSVPVTQDMPLPDVGALQPEQTAALFSMKQGEISGPMATGANGVVIRVVEREEPSAADFDKSKDTLRQTVEERDRGQFFQVFADSLRQRLTKEGKIKINKQELERLVPKEAAS